MLISIIQSKGYHTLLEFFSIIRRYVNKQALTKLYYSFAYPHIKYGIVSWGSACQTYLEKIQVMQNNIIRIINFKFVKDRINMSLLYKSMKILKVKAIYELEIAKFMHLYYHCKLPENFDNYFKNASNHLKYNQRRSSRTPNPPIGGGARPTLGAQVSLKLLFGYVTIFSSADLFTTDLNCRKKLACDIISECYVILSRKILNIRLT